jgi:hypothetical protein
MKSFDILLVSVISKLTTRRMNSTVENLIYSIFLQSTVIRAFLNYDFNYKFRQKLKNLHNNSSVAILVQIQTRNFGHHFFVTSKNCDVNHSLLSV